MCLTGEFEDGQAAGAAVAGLRALGLADEQMEVFSTGPVELGAGSLEQRSRMSGMAVAAAVGLCLLAVCFVAYTQFAYPLVTGGMPLFSVWATGVIFYEMTLLGAIAAIFVSFLRESGLLRAARVVPPAVVEPGRIYLRLDCQIDQLSDLAESLYRAGASRVSKT